MPTTLLKTIAKLATDLKISPNEFEIFTEKKSDRDGDIYIEVSICYKGELLESEEYYDSEEAEIEISDVEDLFTDIKIN